MAKGRSPNYPAYSLEDSISMVGDIFKSEHRNKMSREVVASHLGYSSLSGRALTKIGTLRSYGLLEGAGNELRVSEQALIILNAPLNSSDRQSAVKKCALSPTLFGDLYREFGTRPSPENLKYRLIRMNFTPDAAPVAMEAFMQTMDYAQTWETVVEDSNLDNEKNQSEASVGIKPDREKVLNETEFDAAVGRSRREVFGLDEGDVVIIYPEKITSSSMEDLEEYLALFVRKLKRRNN